MSEEKMDTEEDGAGHAPYKLPAELPPESVQVVVDSREQLPWDLSPLRMTVGSLQSGDYGLAAAPEAIAIERKSLPDLLGCVTTGRPRFERELQRLLGFPARCVIVEASWSELESACWKSKVSGKAVTGSVLRWVADGIPFLLAGNREMAQAAAARMLYLVAKKNWRQARSFASGFNA
jgi:ERCC4-type nuclease